MSRPNTQNLGFPCHTLAPNPGETWGFHVMAWPKPVASNSGETWGFHVLPLMELWVSIFYGTI